MFKMLSWTLGLIKGINLTTCLKIWELFLMLCSMEILLKLEYINCKFKGDLTIWGSKLQANQRSPYNMWSRSQANLIHDKHYNSSFNSNLWSIWLTIWIWRYPDNAYFGSKIAWVCNFTQEVWINKSWPVAFDLICWFNLKIALVLRKWCPGELINDMNKGIDYAYSRCLIWLGAVNFSEV